MRSSYGLDTGHAASPNIYLNQGTKVKALNKRENLGSRRGILHLLQHFYTRISHHPHFSGDESREYLSHAFRKDYEVNGASFLRTIKSTLNGYRYAVNHGDPSIRDRAKSFRDLALTTRHFLLASRLLSENAATARLVRELKTEYNELFGSGGLKEAALNAVVAGLALKERVWTGLFGDCRQPPPLVTKYRMDGVEAIEPGRTGSEALGYAMKVPAEAA